jgi:hypothetical protein
MAQKGHIAHEGAGLEAKPARTFASARDSGLGRVDSCYRGSASCKLFPHHLGAAAHLNNGAPGKFGFEHPEAGLEPVFEQLNCKGARTDAGLTISNSGSLSVVEMALRDVHLWVRKAVRDMAKLHLWKSSDRVRSCLIQVEHLRQDVSPAETILRKPERVSRHFAGQLLVTKDAL